MNAGIRVEETATQTEKISVDLQEPIIPIEFIERQFCEEAETCFMQWMIKHELTMAARDLFHTIGFFELYRSEYLKNGGVPPELNDMCWDFMAGGLRAMEALDYKF